MPKRVDLRDRFCEDHKREQFKGDIDRQPHLDDSEFRAVVRTGTGGDAKTLPWRE